MVEALRPRGMLLAALALWALALCVLAAFGLGGRVGPHPPDLALRPTIPAVALSATQARLGPASDYVEVGNRPLLNADRRPALVSAAGGVDADQPLDAVLTSVLIAGETRLALVQTREGGETRRVRLGENVPGTAWQLVELEPRRAVFAGPQGRTELVLRVFDGKGGEPPTAGAPRDTAQARTPERPAAAPPGAPAPDPAASAGAPAAVAEAPATPEAQVEAIRRRIEARRAQRAAEAAAEREARERAQQ